MPLWKPSRLQFPPMRGFKWVEWTACKIREGLGGNITMHRAQNYKNSVCMLHTCLFPTNLHTYMHKLHFIYANPFHPWSSSYTYSLCCLSSLMQPHVNNLLQYYLMCCKTMKIYYVGLCTSITTWIEWHCGSHGIWSIRMDGCTW